jgi:hypothetical protein
MVHLNKNLEFFCKTCSQLVCSHCIFFEHNGHMLCQTDDINNLLMNNLSDLTKFVYKARQNINTDKQRFEKCLE